MKIFLVRHGETTGDIEDRYGGVYDDHLTDLGRTQLQETAAKIEGKGIEIIFTSPLIRAQESTDIIAAHIHAPIQTEQGLQERNYGVLTGLTQAEALNRYPEAVEEHKNPLNTDPEGESYEAFQNRVLDTFKNITKENNGTVAVVSHGGPIKQILAHLGKEVPEKIGDGEIIELEV